MKYQSRLGCIDETTLVGLSVKALPRAQANQLMLSVHDGKGITQDILYGFCQKFNWGISEVATPCFKVESKEFPKNKKVTCYFCGKPGHKVVNRAWKSSLALAPQLMSQALLE